MNIAFDIRVSPNGVLSYLRGGEVIPVLTVLQACRRLKRSRRQVYRLLKSGLLPLRAKALGECLIDAQAVDRLANSPAQPQRLPAALAALLPEYDLAALNAGVDADLVLLRVLETGGERLISWALRRYGEGACAAFLKRRGSALTPRSRAFWEAFLGVRAAPGPAWRKAGPWRA